MISAAQKTYNEISDLSTLGCSHACPASWSQARGAAADEEIARACRLHEQALACHAEGNLKEAEPLARRALEILERELGPDHPDVANVLNCLAGIREDAGELATAERLYRRSVVILEWVEEDEPDIIRLRVQSLVSLANVHRQQGRYDEAEAFLRRALAVAEKSLGPCDLDTATILNSLGILHKYQGRFDEAEPLYLRALEIKNKILGAEHPDLAMTIHNLATLFVDTGRSDQARVLFRYALGIFATTLGPAHPYVLACRERYEELRQQPIQRG